MSPQDMLAIVLHDYGWAGVFVWLFLRDILPFVKDKWFPAAIEERKKREDWRQKLEERQTLAWEAMAGAMNDIRVVITTNNERLGGLVGAFESHDRSMTEAITVMRERTRPPLESKEKSRLRSAIVK